MSDGRRGTAIAWAVAAVLALIAVWHLAGSGRGGAPGGDAVRIDSGAREAAASAPRGAASSAGIYVDVAGAVRRPGLIQVPAGSRVALAVDRAGGPTRKADLTGVNLAARLQDGQQVLVPVAGAARAAGGAGAAAGAAGAAAPGAAAGAPTLSLSTATVEQLDQLDGIGPTLAQRIVAYRTQHGGFRSIGELREVEGIGEKRFASLKDALQP